MICDKRLGRTASESYEIRRRVRDLPVVHICAFNYRFLPAVRLAPEIMEANELG